MDTIDPGPDSFSEAGEKDTVDEAVQYAESLYVPGSRHPSVYNDKGERVYPKN